MRNFIRNLLYLLILGIGLGPMGFETRAVSAGPEIRADDLELTPDQAQTLKTLNQQFHREQAQIRRKIMIKRMELRTLNAEEIRADEGEELRREIQALLLQARERSLYYRQEAYQVLTPEQRKKIPVETDLGFHCGGWFRRGGRWGMGSGSGGPPASR
ncbi:MAG: Spy/CpxP family protein refolding chaperone [Deltaproteobacteria bacterium]|nr:Spy/CpxP family protein refolding chaperone [Deltaproteobacteria bacterium]